MRGIFLPTNRTLHIRRLRLTALQWQSRLLFTLGGVAVGLAAVGLVLAADQVAAAFQELLALQPFSVLALTLAGFAASSWLAQRCFPNSGGSGIPRLSLHDSFQGRRRGRRAFAPKTLSPRSACEA